VENLRLGAASIVGTGNSLNNTMFGQIGPNTLNGGDGNDILWGREGSDQLFGGNGDDFLDGDTRGDGTVIAAADHMVGGAGNDTYVVHNSGDTVVEDANGGTDLVVSSITFALGPDVENLTLTGPSNLTFSGSGNALDNLIQGHVGHNALAGDAGNDTLLGHGGNDSLDGGAGNDVLDGGANTDTLNGGLGHDIAVFSGNRAAYTVTRLGGTVTVGGPDGTDTLTSIQQLKFADGIRIISTSNDFNSDGKSDVLFSNQGVVFNSNYEWQLNNRSLLAQGAIDLYDKAFNVQVVGDFDGDDKADVLFQNPATGGVWQWRLDGSTILSQGAVDVGDPSFHLLGTADFDGDGRDDVLFRNDAGFVYQWQMDGLHNTPKPVGPLDPQWHVVGTGDFNGDFKADILLRNIGGSANENGAFFLWQMDGNVIAGGGGVERPPTDWKTLGIGDFDGDGKDDFAVRNVSAGPDNGAVWVYLMNGTTIKSQGAAGIADANTWKLQQIGDFNDDGRDDILFRNNTGYFYSWNMNGTTIESEGLLQGAAQWAPPSFQVVTQHWDVV
jgi:hypothetical protein